MTTMQNCFTLVVTTALMAGCATCGPGTVESEGDGWLFEVTKTYSKVCLPISPISDCTDYQMVEEDGGAWRIDRDGAGWRIDRDGAGWRRERDEPHHPADADQDLRKLYYAPMGVCRIGVDPP